MATSTTKIPYIEGAAPATPATGEVVTYAKADGLMYSKDDLGTETLLSGGTPATRASLGLDTTDSPEFAGLNVGAATDTTITRTGAGDIAVEGNAIYRAGGTDVPITDGGTGASTAAAARTNLGLVPGIVKLDATVAPAVTDDSGDGYSVGSVWVDVTGDAAYLCVDDSVGAAVWIPFDSSSGESWEGAWSAGTYTLGQIVEHDDVIYQVNAASTTDEPPSADWDVLYTAPAGGGPLLYVDSLAVGATGDEFADMSAWTATGSVSNTLVTTNVYDATIQRLVFTSTGSTDRYTKTAPDTDFTAYLTMYGTDQEDLIGWAYVNTSGTGVGIGWRGGAVWAITVSGWNYASSPTQVWSDPPDWPIAGSPYMGSACAFRIARSGSDIIVAVSFDCGSTWLAVHTFTGGSPAGSKLWELADFLNPSTYRLNVGRLTVV